MDRLKNSSYISNLEECCNHICWDVLNNKRILFSGASGLIGTAFIDAVMYENKRANRNITVIGIGRSLDKAKSRFQEYFGNPLFQFFSQDVTQPFTFDCKVDYIIHGASNTHPIAYASDPIGTITTNVFGMNNLLEYAVQKQCSKVVLLSSVEIYGESLPGQASFKEDSMGYIDCNTLRAGYPESKRTAEALCKAFGKKYGLETLVGRLARIYGPTMEKDDSKALSQFLKKGASGEDIVLKSKGEQFFSYLYSFDAVTAIFSLISKGIPGEAYNIASKDSNIHLKDLAAMIAGFSGKHVIFELPNETEQQGYSKASHAILNSEKLEAIGWHAVYPIEKGVKHTLQFLKDEVTGK